MRKSDPLADRWARARRIARVVVALGAALDLAARLPARAQEDGGVPPDPTDHGGVWFEVTAGADEIRVRLPKEPPADGVGGRGIRIRSLPAHTGAGPDEDAEGAWAGPWQPDIAFPRRDPRGRDRLFRRFDVADAATGETLAGPRWVTGFFGLERPTDSPIGIGGKKGLCCTHSLDDAQALGVRHLARNITLRSLVDPGAGDPEIFQEVDGRRIGMRAENVRALDRWLRDARSRGMAVTGVLYNPFPRDAPSDDPLVHPETNRADAPMAIGAFDTRTPEGILHLRAALEFLADRYARPDGDASHGRLHALVIGNEVNSHWVWNNQGDAEPEAVVRDYHVAVRLADLATRSRHAAFPIYVSLEHHWAVRYLKDAPLRTVPGRQLLEAFHDTARAGGDFPWQVAFHPYPENLFQPDFWNDREAPRHPDAAKISFRNLEVLVDFLDAPARRFAGIPRRIALTEQGFNWFARWGEQRADEIQAAAYAMAFRKVRAMPTIDTFIYHRHVDSPQEGGLSLGLRAFDPSAPRGMGAARPIWEVMRAADTPDEDAAHAFALEVIGIPDWQAARPATTLDPESPAHSPDESVVFDFIAHQGSARLDRTLAWSRRETIQAAGWLAEAVLQHPETGAASRAAFTIDLPATTGDPRRSLVLRTGTWLGHPDGRAAFQLLVDDEPVLHFTPPSGDTDVHPHDLDLSRFAGRTVEITLAIDPLGPNAHDWTHWVEPRILLE